jgi:restriction endonuclease S subunit
MKEYRVPIPPIDLQRKFEKAAVAMVDLTSARKRAAEEAKALFGSLVQRAFRGGL